MADVIRIPWGTWELETGRWEPNMAITNYISVLNQHYSNLEAGYSCEHACDPKVCIWCNDERN